MPTPTGLPKVGEVWELAISIPGRQIRPRRVVVIERSAGEYWSLRVAYRTTPDGPWQRHLWVDASYHLRQGWLRYIGPAGPNTKASLGLG
jgi:hypothetical protein